MRLCEGKVQAYKGPNALIWYANVYGVPAIAALGVLGNLINAIVLAINGKRIPSYSYLLALSISDCVFLIFGTFEVTPITLDVLSSDPAFNRFYTSVVLYVRIISSAAFKFSVLLVVAFNVERYVCVCHPLHANEIFNPRSNRWRLCLASLLCLLLSIHWPLAYVEDSCFDSVTNATFYMVHLNPDTSTVIYDRTMNYISMIGFNMTPILILVVLNALIIRTLRTVIRRDRRSSIQTNSVTVGGAIVAGGGRRQHQQQSRCANALLFAVVVMFLICNGPQVPGRVLLERLGPGSPLVQTYVAVSQQLIFLNASFNFCLYCLVSRRYRDLLRKTLMLVVTGTHSSSSGWRSVAFFDTLGSKWSAWRESLRLRRSSHSSRRGIVSGEAAAAAAGADEAATSISGGGGRRQRREDGDAEEEEIEIESDEDEDDGMGRDL